MKYKWLWVGLFLVSGIGIVMAQIKPHKPKGQVAQAIPDYTGVMNPSFTVNQINGTPLSLSQYKNKVILVDFWATWCPPCVASVEHLNDLYSKYQSKGLVIIGLTVDKDLEPVPQFIADHQIRYPIGIATPTEIKMFGGVSGIPTVFLLDRNHRVIKKWVGYQDPEVLRQAILPLL